MLEERDVRRLGPLGKLVRAWRRKPYRFTGVDISPPELRVAEVCFTAGGPEVVAARRFPLPFSAQDELTFSEDLAAALQQAVQDTGAGGQRVVTAIPGERVITRHIRIPPVPPKEIDGVLRWEAERYIPLPVDELIIRYVNLGQVKGARGPELHLLLAAVPETLARECHRCFAAAGLRLVAIDLQALALWRVFAGISIEEKQDPGTYAVINIDAPYSQLVVIREGRLQYTRSLPQGVRVTVQADVENVELASGEPEGVIYRAALKEFAREVQRSLSWYQAQDREHPVAKMVLSGAGSKVRDVGSYLADRLGMPVVMGEPPIPFNTPAAYDPALAMAIGLALWGVIP